MKQPNALICAVLLGTVALLIIPSADAQVTKTREQRERERSGVRNKEVVVEAKYPKTERKQPERQASKIAGDFKKLIDFSNNNQFDQAIKMGDAVLANPKANAYERSVAAQVAAYAWTEKDTTGYTSAVTYMERALSENGLDNNAHFDLMYQLAQTQLVNDNYAAALELLTRFLTESKSAKPEAYALQGNAYYRQDKFEEAIAAIKKALEGNPKPDKSWNQLLMASYFELDRPLEAASIAEAIAAQSPDDKVAQLNLANIYMQADQLDKAAGVFDRLRAAGKLTESKDYEIGYKLLANIDGREKDAVNLINEGLAKGILKPSFEVYNFLGQSNYFSDQIPAAIAAWTKAAPLDKNGETYLNLAKVQAQEDGGSADAKVNARQALAKGISKQGEAWIVIARAEGDLGNRPAMIEAYREAAKFPETRDQASKILRQIGASK